MNHHIVPLKIYFAIFAALMAGTALTVWAAFQDFGEFNTLVAVVIAVVKAALVVLFFMHVKYSDKLIWVFASAGFIWLIILFAFTLMDPMTRDWLPVGAPLPM
ncbi:MAG: cytochrome C oxidase subunit IV family protein [Verrucomicrobia bacterium]|nr:cytochrome C oxidase subunit IV family protein [Verrucomicrobiota bacterium]